MSDSTNNTENQYPQWNIDRIAALVVGGETETVEFKESTGRRREAASTICAFLNTQGGHLLFGVRSNGELVGQDVGYNTIEEVSTELQRINPKAYPTIERIPMESGREIIVVSTNQGSSKPYSYQGSAYRRVGNTTLTMSDEYYNNVLFERMHSAQRWENQIADGWTIDDLDLEEIQRTVRVAVERGRLKDPETDDPVELLLGLDLLCDGVLLRAATVLFGKKEQIGAKMPQCLLRVARFRGFDKMVFLDNRKFAGNAFKLLAHAESFLRDSLPIAGRFESDRFERIDEPLYPVSATREALANALCHRDYSAGGSSVDVAIYDDRLEITSTGSLHFGLTPEKLFVNHQSRPWNPLIAHAFYRRGIIEEWGRGTIEIANALIEAKLPPPEIQDSSGSVTVRFRSGQLLPERRVLRNKDAIGKSIESVSSNPEIKFADELYQYLYQVLKKDAKKINENQNEYMLKPFIPEDFCLSRRIWVRRLLNEGMNKWDRDPYCEGEFVCTLTKNHDRIFVEPAIHDLFTKFEIIPELDESTGSYLLHIGKDRYDVYQASKIILAPLVPSPKFTNSIQFLEEIFKDLKREADNVNNKQNKYTLVPFKPIDYSLSRKIWVRRLVNEEMNTFHKDPYCEGDIVATLTGEHDRIVVKPEEHELFTEFDIIPKWDASTFSFKLYVDEFQHEIHHITQKILQP